MNDSPASRCSQKTGRAIPAASPMPTEKRCTTSRRAEHTGEHGPRGKARGKGQRDELGLIAHLGHEYEEQGHPKSRHRVLLGNKAPQGEPLLHAECMASPVDRGRGELCLALLLHERPHVPPRHGTHHLHTVKTPHGHGNRQWTPAPDRGYRQGDLPIDSRATT